MIHQRGTLVNTLLRFVSTTIIGGALFLLPVVVTLYILRQAVHYVAAIVHPVARALSLQSIVGAQAPNVLAAVLLVLLAFAAGLIARTRAGVRIGDAAEHLILRGVPGFTLIKSMTGPSGPASETASVTVALARIDEAWLLAFVMERDPNGMLTVFVPSAPTPAARSVYFLRQDQIQRLDMPVGAAVRCIMQLGVARPSC
jgi:uncharacterized membrane protein